MFHHLQQKQNKKKPHQTTKEEKMLPAGNVQPKCKQMNQPSMAGASVVIWSHGCSPYDRKRQRQMEITDVVA